MSTSNHLNLVSEKNKNVHRKEEEKLKSDNVSTVPISPFTLAQ